MPDPEEGVVGVEGDIAEAGIWRPREGILRERLGRAPRRRLGAMRNVGVDAAAV